ncbi:MAG: PrgI family protein [Patescibacteria group bacterium]|nr:PrgI family protein [Patescibacteria group bacterium]
MENHPIPQDVTGFQFKLIGDMTIKQFAYLAAGSILAYITFILPIFALIKFPMAFFFFILGVAVAFVPIGGRPLETMLTNFIKALISPNQYIFLKQGGNLGALLQYSPTKQALPQQQKAQASKLESYLQSLPRKSKNQLDEKEAAFLQSINSQAVPLETPLSTSPTFSTSPTSPRINTYGSGIQAAMNVQNQTPFVVSIEEDKQKKEEEEKASEEKKESGSKAEAQKIEEALKKAESLQKELQTVKTQEVLEKQSGRITNEMHQKVLDLEKELSETLSQKNNLEKKLFDMQKKYESQNQQVFTPSTAQAPKSESPNIRKIPKGLGARIGLPFTPEVPNLITGIIKDPRGNVLGNILVEIKDKEQNPVRAFKTSPLGQFACATPLSNGTYTIEFEDPSGKNKFDAVEIQATGEIIMPIEIISTDAREELRKELFG